MKSKILIILIILILGISAVWAENETRTFEDIQNAINTSDQIVYLNNSEYIGDGNEITIDRDVIIDGGDKTGIGRSTLNANGLSRIFTITDNHSVILQNINLINGKTKENGGAILFNSTGQIALYLCTLTNNTAENGGSIYTTEGQIISYCSNFTNNACLENGEIIFSGNTVPEIAYSNLYDGTIYTNARLIENLPTSEYEPLIDSEVELYFGKNNFGFIGDDNYTLLMYKPLFNGTFPERFDLREYGYVGPVRNQGSTGTCWAQTIVGALESAILKASDGAALDKNEGLSVANMMDTIRKYIMYVGYANNGVNINYAVSDFISWLGPTRYNNAPFLGYYVEPTIYPNMFHVQNILTIMRYNMTAIKQALMDYGGLYATGTVQNPAGFGNNNYYPEHLMIDHAMLLVGWDDNYSRYNFNPVNGEYPPGDGAWIVKNSWGENWAYKGYCYISYYDGTYLHSFDDIFAFIFNDTIRFNKNYQNTITGKGSSFSDYDDTAEENFTAADDDYLAAFSTYFYTRCNYTASIYINNNLALTQKGIQDLTGYFTIELDKYLPIRKGDLFTIKIQFSSLTDEICSVYQTFDRMPFIRGFTTRALVESIQNKIGYASSGDEIFLNNKTYYSSAGEKAVIINKDITINGAKSNGQGFSTIDASYLDSVFKIAKGCTLTLKNVNIINSKSTAIIVDEGAFANILNCNFTDNVGENGNSIAIYGEATIKNCIINNKNSGIGEIYVAGSVNLENNRINSKAAGIYNNGIIKTQTNLIFNNINSYVNVPTQITASLTDDNGNSINANTNINLDDFGQMTFNNNQWTFDYVPTTTETKTLSGSINFQNLNIQNGFLTINSNAPLIIAGGTYTYSQIAYVRLTLKTDKLGLYDVYIDDNKIETYIATSTTPTINLPQMTIGTHTVRIISVSDATYNNVATVEIVPADVNLEIRARNINYGEQSTIEVTLKDANDQALNEAVVVTLCGKTYNLNLVNGKARFNITERYDVNEYPVIATFSGNTYYNPATAKTTMRVSKVTPKFEIEINEFYTDEYGLVVITFDESVTGLVELHATPYKLSNAQLSNGKLIYDMRMTESGPRDFYFQYHGNKNYYPTTSQTVQFYVMERGSFDLIGGSFDYGTTASITLITPIAGDIDLYVDDYKKGRYSTTSAKLEIELNDLTCGSHRIKAEYVSDTSKYCEGTVTINKINPNLTITTNNPQNGENLIIYLQLTGLNGEKIDSDITVTLNGVPYSIYLINGEGSIKIFDKLKVGSHTITSKFKGNSNYNEINVMQTVTIDKKTPILSLDVENIEYGDEFIVVGNINSDATGTVTFYIDGVKSESVSITNGKVRYSKNNLNMGQHQIYAIYSGDDNYKTITTTTTQFNVGNSEISVRGGKFDYNTNTYIFVRTANDADVNVYINNENIGTYRVTTDGLQINLPISNVGTYNIYVEYAGDTTKNSRTTVEIQKIAPQMSITANNINYGEILKVTIELKGATNNPLTGDTLLTINEKTYPVHITQGRGTIEITDPLDAKTYTITATFTENDNYKTTTIQKTVSILKITPTITVTTENINPGSPFTATATVSDGAIGTVEFYLNGVNIGSSQINNGRAEYVLTTLESGTHTLYATYIGNNNYNEVTSTVLDFNIDLQGTIILTAENAEYGKTAHVTIKTSEDTLVNVYVDNKKIGTYTISTTGTQITLPQLTMGSHTIKAEYAYNTAVNSQTTMDILRSKPILILTVKNANYRESFSIELEVQGIPAEDLAGGVMRLNAKINNIPYPIYLSNGKGSIEVFELLNVGEYIVSVSFPGSIVYQPVTVEETLTISPIDPTITIDTNNIKYGQTFTTTVNINNYASGTMDLYIDGEKVGSSEISDNKATFQVTKTLNSGDHSIYAYYHGDGNYNPMTTPTTNFNVGPQGIMTVTGGTFEPGENAFITIKSSEDTNVNIYVDNNFIGTQRVTTTGTVVNLPTMSIGTHNIKVENANDPSINSQTTVEISKRIPTITISALDVEYGQMFTATANINSGVTGNVDFYIDNEKVGSIQINNGKATYTTNTLTAESHTLYAIYTGNSEYDTTTSQTITFNVEPKLILIVIGDDYNYLGEPFVTVQTNRPTQINLYINNTKLDTYTITSNSFQISIPNLDAGTYQIKVESVDNPSINDQTTVTINKITPAITMLINEIEYGKTFTAIANVDNDVTGNVEFYIDGMKVKTIQINNGKATYTTNTLTTGTHTIYATYTGNNNYDMSTTTTLSFNVDAEPTISISGGIFNYLEDIFVTIETNKLSELNVYVNNTRIGIYTILSDTLTVPLLNLNAGTHNVKVEYLENPSKYAQTTVTINKITPTININANDAKYGETFTATANINSSITGNIEFYIDGVKVDTIQINNGKATYTTNSLNEGTHTIKAIYTGNNNYNTATTETTNFNIDSQPTITISGANYNYLEDTYITIQTNKQAQVNIYINNTKIDTYTITENNLKIKLPTLNAGTHTIKAEYTDRTEINTQTTITINKINPTISITANEVEYGETFTATANINSSITGNIEFYIDNVKVGTIQINNGKATYTTNSLNEGTHTIKATYTGNNNYNAANTETINFNIDSQPTITISSANYNYLEDAYITIQTNKQAQVNIYINNTKLDTYAMNGNTLRIKLPTLNAGTHTIKAEYADRTEINNQTTITINKINPTINITANGVEYGETFTATANINSNITGNIEFYIDGEKAGTAQINNGKATYTTNSLNEGTHTIKAIYTGNNNYNTATTETTNFNIDSQPTITISGANYNYLEDAYITIQTNKQAQVNIYINNTKLNTYVITGNSLRIKLPTLNAGTHTIKAEYTDRTEINTQTTITINKITPTLTLTSNNILYGETVTVVLNSPENITGIVELYLNNKKEGQISIVNGKGQYELNSLNIGVYEIYGKFMGNLNYNSTTSNLDEIIVNNISTIGVVGGQFQYGNDPYVLINTNKANTVNVYIDDVKIGSYDISTNTYRVDLGKLYVGNYTIKVEYSDDSSINDSTTVEIIKIAPTIDITVNNITYGENIIINGNISSGATGFVEIYLNGDKINKTEIQNGKITYEINKPNSGIYNLYIKYNGDENYKEIISTTIPINVSKQKSNLTITTDKFTHLTNGTIYVTVLSNSTTNGEVILTIDGKTQIKQTLKNGTAIFNTNLLKAGLHTLNAVYSGDNNHYSSSNNITITVEKTFNEMTYEIITDEDGNVKIKVTVPKDDNNNVKFIMNEKVQNVPLDGGIGFVDLSELKEGTYNFKLQYEGDYYNVKDIENTVTIPKKITEETFNIATENVVMYYKNGSGIKAILTNNKGKAISGEKITILINYGEYTRTTNDKGEIFFEIKLNPKNYEATLIYKNVTKTANITVKSTIVGNNLIKYFQNGSQFQFKVLDNVGKPLAKQKVTLNINGVFYTRTTNNDGIATMEINLPVGSYIITLNSTRNSEITSFNVTVLSKLKADNVVKYYQNNTQYKVQLLDDNGKPLSNKQITLNINGVFYTRTTNNDGIATMTINLPVGDYIITVQYGSSVTSNNVSVLSKIKSENLAMSANNRKAFKITALDNNGKPIGGKAVSFNINGVYYNRTTKADGSASLDMNLPSGEYIITTMYDNQVTSNKVTIKG